MAPAVNRPPDDQLIEDILAAVALALPDEPHARRCAAFAAALFDDLHATLGLDASDRPLAIGAALLHDVGYLRGGRDHHRKSFDIIRGATALPYDDADRLIVALVARYHGHTLPNIEHAGFGELEAGDQRRVRRLAALVRVAAAADGSHLGIVHGLRADGDERRVTFHARASEEPAVDRDRLREAAGGFAQLTQIPARVEVAIGNG